MMPGDEKLRKITASERLFRLVLMVYPAVYRREYGALMQQAFRDLYRDTHWQEGWLGVFRLWKRVLIDVGVTALDEHLEAYKEGTKMKKLLVEEAIRTMALVGVVLFGVLPLAVVLYNLDPAVVLRYALPVPFLLFPILVVIRSRTGYELMITTRRQWNILCSVLFLNVMGTDLVFAALGAISLSKAVIQGGIATLAIAAMALFGPRIMRWQEKQ